VQDCSMWLKEQSAAKLFWSWSCLRFQLWSRSPR